MKPIFPFAAAIAIAAIMAAAPTIAGATTPAHKSHAARIHKAPIHQAPIKQAKISTTTVTPVAGNACADADKAPTYQPGLASCTGLRTPAGTDAAAETDMRGAAGDNSGAVGAKTADITDTDGFIGMGTTRPAERK